MSSQRASLIGAILEAPEDDALRLICADWFEEQGDPASVARAEFIRTQVTRARLPPDDVRQSELQARELRLLKRHAAAWCGSHFVFKKVRFRRGFIEYVHLHLRHFLHHRRQMLALEPVRDVRLTGWYRAPDDLVGRVAACEEWKHVETLRIHHQGPHHDPRGNLLLLLESPHLTRLRALRCPLVEFDAEARRRFERLPVLHRVAELKSLLLPSYPSLPSGMARRLSEMPFWDRLEELECRLPGTGGGASEVLSVLRERMPGALRELRLSAGSIPDDYSQADVFFERLAEAPLRGLFLQSIPISPAALGRLLGAEGRCRLTDLSLAGCDLTAEHVRLIANSPRAEGLRGLKVNEHELDGDVARALFSSEHLRSLVRLDLSGTSIGTEGARAFAAAKGWERLRALDVTDAGLDEDGLRTLLASPGLRQLTWLAVGESGYRGRPALNIPPDVATLLTRLPHLASFRLTGGHCDARSREILSTSDSLAWVMLDCDDEGMRAYRAARAPGRWPPIDTAPSGWWGRDWKEGGGAPV
jgi:uncharacterized protein (TIGR02996 family)